MHVQSIISAQDAFTFLQNGKKNIVCRHIDGEFCALDQHPATVFFNSEYQFGISIDLLNIAGIQFTKPLEIDEVEDDQDIFIVQLNAVIQQYKYQSGHQDLHIFINSGFAQRDFDNAKLQYEALCKMFGGTTYEASLEVIGDKNKRKRKSADKNSESNAQPEQKTDDAVQVTSESQCQLIIDAIATCANQDEIDSTCADLDHYDFDQDQLSKIADAKQKQSQKIDPELFDETDPNIKSILSAIEDCKDNYYLELVLGNLNANEHKFHNSEYQELIKRVDAKRESFIEAKNNQKKSKNDDHQDLINDLINQVSKAQSPAEANSVYQHAKGWTEQQIAPLHAAVGRRLSELQQPASKEPPSLLVRIQKATDLTELDALESEVLTRDPQIVPALMSEVRKRRAQLKNSEAELTP